MFLCYLVAVLLVVLGVQGNVPLGCNLGPVTDRTTTNPFIDVVKQSYFGTFPSLNPLPPTDLDENGWPLVDFVMVVYTSSPYWAYQDVDSISGNYILTYTGPQCEINATTIGANVSEVSCNGGNCGASVSLYGDQLILGFTNTLGNVKNISLFKKGLDPADIFDPNYLALLTPFAGVLRLMNWQSVSRSDLANWTDRALVTDATWTREGVPYEIQILLGNTLNRDIWINLPILVDAYFIQQLAILVKTNLKPNLNVYLENSNEVWNGAFTAYRYNLAAAIAEVEADPNCPLNYDNLNVSSSRSQGIWAWRRSGWRSMNISVIFASVWGQEAINDRVRVLFAGQSDYPTGLSWALEMIAAVFGPPSNYLYTLAGGGYLNLGTANNYNNLTTADEVLAVFNSTLQTYAAANCFEQNFALARNYSLRYVAYEGGIDTFGPNDIEAKRNAVLDPRIAYVMNTMLDTWFSWGFDNFNWFTCDPNTGVWNTSWGTYGLVLTTHNLTTVKYETAVAYVSASPPVTAGNSVNGLIDARNFSDYYAGTNPPPYWNKRYGSVRNYTYAINSPVTAVYGFSISFANNTKNYTMPVYVVDTNSYAVIDVLVNTTNKAFVFSPPVNVTLNQGINLLVLDVIYDDAYSMQYLKFTKLDEINNDSHIVALSKKQRMAIN